MTLEGHQSKPNVYVAAPLFSAAERAFNLEIRRRLAPYFDLFLPQLDGGLMVNLVAEGMGPKEAAQKVFKIDVDALNRCDLVVVILDGRSIDEGACFELGYAFASGKPCYGLQTDVRRLLPHGNNPMIECALTQVFESLETLVMWAKDHADSIGSSENIDKRHRDIDL